ncbi:MAG: HD domain-containing phosphohydrolase [Myxococcales bacterium]
MAFTLNNSDRCPSPSAVLVVDQEPQLWRSASRALERTGVDVLHASSGMAARTALRTGNIAVVVLDIDPPNADAMALLRDVHRDFPEVELITLGSAGSKWRIHESLNCGASSFLGKPLDPLLLNAQVSAARRSFEMNRRHRTRYLSLEGSLQEARWLLEELPRQLAQQLCSAWELRHVETGAHIRRIGDYSELLAVQLGFDAAAATTLGHLAMLHDVGKMAIPDAILTKPGKLTVEELAIMKLHPEVGARMLTGLRHPFLDRAATVALCHHERWDGSGYPGKLRADECPEDARIVAVADVYDALGQARCYKPGWSNDAIVSYFRESSGTLFEPRIVAALLDNLPRLREIAMQLPETEVQDDSGYRLRIAERARVAV